MSNSNLPESPASSRVTLKLKPGAHKSPSENKVAPIPGPQNTSKLKPGAHWSDEYKQRMQEEMDALRR
jgi:hypothetical protein